MMEGLAKGVRDMRWLRPFSLATAAGLYLIVLMGALVTKTGSEDGCGTRGLLHRRSFHLRHGRDGDRIQPPDRFRPGRIDGGDLAVWAWRRFRKTGSSVLAVSGVFFIVFQGLLGAAAVVWEPVDAVIALHFDSLCCPSPAWRCSPSTFPRRGGRRI